MFIGHAPDVNNFSLNLIDHEDVKELKLGFKNASVCKINYDHVKGAGEFEWFLESESMKLIIFADAGLNFRILSLLSRKTWAISVLRK